MKRVSQRETNDQSGIPAEVSTHTNVRDVSAPVGEAAFALPRPNKTFVALTASALALPGIAGSARADAPIDRASADASFSYYKEDDIRKSRFLDNGGGSRERYEVFTKQLRFDFPLTKRTDLGISYLYEEMSGASPWFVRPNPDTNNRRPVQVMSGATIEDERHDLLVDVDFFLDRGKDTLSAGFSKERDYLAINFGLAAERHLNDKNTTVSTAGGFSYDWIDPTDAKKFPTLRPSHEEKWSIDLFAGLSQILSRASTAQVTFNYKHSDGYLSDPYKAIQGFLDTDDLLPDARPDKKDQLSILFRYRHHLEGISASLHGDYRFYVDDWGILSHTLEVAWYQNIFGWLTLTPSARWYSQSKADFYDSLLPQGTTSAKQASNDFRLSPYGAVSAKIKADIELLDLWNYRAPEALQRIGISSGLDLILSLSYERYISDGNFATTTVSESDEAPGLVAFHVFAFSVSGRF